MKSGSSWGGPSQKLWTTEEIGGQRVRMQDNFRAYGSYADSSQDHLAMLKKSWPDAANATTDDAALAGLHNGRYGAYATAGNYDDAMKQRLAYIKPGQADDLSKTIGQPSDQDQAMQQALRQSKQAQDAMAQLMKATTAGTSQSLTSLDQNIGQLGSKAATATPGMTSLSGSLDQMLGSLTKGMGGAGASSGGGAGLGGLFTGLFSLFHEGGLVGYSNTAMRAVSPAIFAGAPRFHDGLGDDEFPAILQRGERVLTANQDQRATAAMSRMADAMANASTPAGTQRLDSGRQPSGGNHISMIVQTPNASSFRYSQSQIMAQTHAALGRMGSKHN
jgi:flagellum-specific peptidoglycan hydrolase FlgJ